MDSGLQLPSAPLVVSGAATPVATERCGAFSVWCRVFYCCHRVCHSVSVRWSEGACKPSRPDTLKKAKQPRVLKKVTIAQRVEKYGKYGLYDNNGAV